MIDEIPAELVEKGECFEQKYCPVLNFEEWVVAMLRQIEKTNPVNFCQAERHNETNEVFILTEGEADLIVFDNGNEPGKDYIIQMKKSVAYNIPKNTWHHVVMGANAHIILIEKKNTSRENSNYFTFKEERINAIKDKFRIL